MRTKFWVCVVAAVATMLLGVGTAQAAPEAVHPSASIVYTAVDADGGVYWRYSPYWPDTDAVPGQGFYTGNQIELKCWVFGGPAGPNNNTLWYLATNVTHPGDGSGYINDHYLNTPGTAANPQPQGTQCLGPIDS